MAKAAFLDRDGIVNTDKGYVFKKEDITFVPGIFELCRLLETNHFQIILITNQSGIARGLFTVKDFHRLTDWIKARFKDRGITLSGVYFCPHHPTEGKGELKKDCPCRKPRPGMIYKARQEQGINLDKSLLIGDKLTDIQAGISAGLLENYLIRQDIGPMELPSACRRFPDLKALVKYLKTRSP